MPDRVRSTQIVIPLFIAITLVLTWPIPARFSSKIPSNRTAIDPSIQAFLLGWDIQSITCNPLKIFDAPIFHPEPRTLTYMDHMIGETIIAAPALLIASVAAGYNGLVLLSFAISAWATYRLVRLFQVPRTGAFLCGFLFAFSPYRFANLDQLNQLQTQFLPLGLFFLMRYVQRWRFRDAIGAAIVWVAQVYFGWYYAYYLTLALGLLVLYALVGRSWRPPSSQYIPLLMLVPIVLLSILPATWPYIEQRLAMPEFHRSLGESALYSADILDYLRINPSSILAGLLPLPIGPQSYCPGVVSVVLGAVGVWAIARRWRTASGGTLFSLSGFAERTGLSGYFLVLTLVSFILSLGPILHVAGQRIWIPLPYSLMYFVVPGFSSMRAPARLAVLTLLGLIALAGFGYRHIAEQYKHRVVAWRCLVIGIIIVAGLCALVRPISLLELPRRRTMPIVYRWLAAKSEAWPVVEFPVPARDADETKALALRQFCALYHGKPRVDGCSGFTSPRYRAFRLKVQTFPSEPAVAAVAEMGVRWVVVHYGDYPRAEQLALPSRIAAAPRLVQRARFNGDAVYELVADPPEPKDLRYCPADKVDEAHRTSEK